MADTAPQTQYRDEYIAAYEQLETLLRMTVTTEAVIKGNTAVFLVTGSGGAEAQTRGTNGLIAARPDSNAQNSCVLQEWHDLVRKTGFNIFESQSNQIRIMQETSVGVLNRKTDALITTALDTGTVSIGTVAETIPNVSLVMNGAVKLQNAGVPWDSNITLLCQPSFLAYLMQATEFASAQYVSAMPFEGDNAPWWNDRPMMYVWNNLKVISHPNLTGRGTSSEYSYMYHKSSIGHAMNTEGLKTAVGYFEEQDYSFARASAYQNAKVLQNTGIVVIGHDGSAYA